MKKNIWKILTILGVLIWAALWGALFALDAAAQVSRDTPVYWTATNPTTCTPTKKSTALVYNYTTFRFYVCTANNTYTAIDAAQPVTDPQVPNRIYAGPVSGASSLPSFRALVAADIPALPTTQITSGVFSDARIPALGADKITSGTFDAARIPNLDGSIISTGTVSASRLGSGTANSSTYLRGDGAWTVPPTGIQDTDTRLEKAVESYANFTTAVDQVCPSDPCAAPVTLRVNTAVTTNATKALPAGLYLSFGSAGKLTVAAGHTVTVKGMDDPGNRKVFETTGTGKVIFAKSAVKEINLAWWTGNASGGNITEAMDEALESVNATSGRIYVPAGYWYSAGEHDVTHGGIQICGAGNGPSDGIQNSTVIRLQSPTGAYLFKIGESKYSNRFCDMILDGTGTTSKDGILLEGTGGPSTPSGDLSFEHVTLQNFNRGLNFSASASWQFAQIYFAQSIFQGNNTAIRSTSVNSQLTTVSTNFTVANNGIGLDIVSSGPVNIIGSEFAANPGMGATAIKITGSHGVIKLDNYQDEGFATSISNEPTAPDMSGIISIVNSNIQSKIMLKESCVVNSFGSIYLSNAVQDQAPAAAVFNSFGDHVRAVDVTTTNGTTPVISPPKLANFTSNSILNEYNSTNFNNTQRMPWKIAPGAALLDDVTNPVLSIGHYNPGANKPQLRVGRADAAGVMEFYYDISRENVSGDNAGELEFTGNQSGFIGYSFNGPGYFDGAVRGRAGEMNDTSTVVIDPEAGNHQFLVMSGNRTFSFATFSAFEQTRADGQRLTLELIQDSGGSRTCSLTTGVNEGFSFGSDITSITCSTAANKRDILEVVYSKRARRWLVTNFKKGFD